MRIEITGKLSTGANTPALMLCTSAPASDLDPIGPLEGWTLSMPRVIQTSHPCRATHATHYNRGGRTARLQFSCYRKFPSRREAEDFCLSHEGTLPQGGTVRVTTDSDAGAQVRVIANAEIAEPVFTHIGKLVLITYQIVGAAIS
jgi:hypothetical protein